jgi:hypothetical protein
LKEFSTINAIRITDHGNRPITHLWQHIRRDFEVVIDQVAFFITITGE